MNRSILLKKYNISHINNISHNDNNIFQNNNDIKNIDIQNTKIIKQMNDKIINTNKQNNIKYFGRNLNLQKYNKKIISIDFKIIKDFNIKTKYQAMIIEPREHHALEFVLHNFLDNLGIDWSIIIFCSDHNKNYLLDIVNKFINLDKNRIKIIRFTESNIDIPTYNRVCFSKKTYEFIESEMFIIFQTDSMILKENKDKLHQFMNYDYVGAPFDRNAGWRRSLPMTDNYDVGNGGLSLRRKSKMLEILDNKKKFTNEDTYFSYYDNIKKPNAQIAQEFSIETTFYDKPFGIHKIWNYLNEKDLSKLISVYPEIKTLIELQKWNDIKKIE